MGNKLNCVIIDDERHAVDLLADHIEAMPNLHLLEYYTDPLQALLGITGATEKIDILFMDVDMPTMTGLVLSEAIRHKIKYLIITTAHSKYAVDAFGVQANDYLLKPISLNKFALVVNRLLKFEADNSKVVSAEDFFYVRTDQAQKLVRINIKDLLAIEGGNNYINIHTLEKMHTAYLTMKEMETKLEGYSSFIRVHRSFIISSDWIEKVEGGNITLRTNLIVPLGGTYKKDFFTLLEKKTLRTSRNLPA